MIAYAYGRPFKRIHHLQGLIYILASSSRLCKISNFDFLAYSSYESSLSDLVSLISSKFESDKQDHIKAFESPIFKRKRLPLKPKSNTDLSLSDARPQTMYSKLSKREIPLRKGKKNNGCRSGFKGLKDSDRQLLKKMDSTGDHPERILVLATPRKKMKPSNSTIFQSG